MRYALYFVPEDDTALARFGADWFAAAREEAAGARVYGFHATLKPPFRLAAATSAEGLHEAVADFAAAQAPFTVAPLHLGDLGGFLALRPSRPAPALHALADACVRAFDPFRAPAPADEIARRQKANLSPRQQDFLVAWGYPYVFEEFRFHLTLTDSLDAERRAAVWAELEGALGSVVQEPLEVRSLALCGQPPGGDFSLIRRFPLG